MILEICIEDRNIRTGLLGAGTGGRVGVVAFLCKKIEVMINIFLKFCCSELTVKR
jgi:hypothetical protein